MKRIVVAGGTGFIGEPLVRHLLNRGDEVTVLSRDPARVPAGRAVPWDPPAPGGWTVEVQRADAVVNLAGENVGGGRWAEARKRKILESRIAATGALVTAMRGSEKPMTLINASATGFYGDRGDEPVDETSSSGAGFLAGVTRKWEEAAGAAEPFARVVILRFGIVLASDGGALAKLLLPFRLGAGGPMGSGRQWMPWVDREDVLRMIEWSIDTEAARGIYNATAGAVTNRDFARALGHALHRPSLLPTPALALRLALGSGMADEMLLSGQRVSPSRASSEGFAFRFPELASALEHAIAR